MAIRCSVLGHDFGGAEREREREDRGGEVVVTTREIEICRNCGETRLVSESKEVIAARHDSTPAHDPASRPATSPTDTPDTPRSETEDRTGSGETPVADERERAPSPPITVAQSNDQSEFRSDSPTDSPRATPDSDTDANSAMGSSPTRSTDGAIEYDIEDHGLIAHDTGGHDASGQDTSGHEPSDSIDTPESADQLDDEIDRLEIEDGPDRPEPEGRSSRSGSKERAHGEWPAEPASRFEDVSGSGSSADGTNRERAGWDSPLDGGRDDHGWSPPGEGVDGDADRVPTDGITQGALVCPRCGFEQAVAASALRAGDICPECHHGYLSWETRKG